MYSRSSVIVPQFTSRILLIYQTVTHSQEDNFYPDPPCPLKYQASLMAYTKSHVNQGLITWICKFCKIWLLKLDKRVIMQLSHLYQIITFRFQHNYSLTYNIPTSISPNFLAVEKIAQQLQGQDEYLILQFITTDTGCYYSMEYNKSGLWKERGTQKMEAWQNSYLN